MNAWPYPFWFAHRGAGKLAPENTLAAFRVGASHGFRAFECDLNVSTDGEPFLMHDRELRRTTGADGLASDRRWGDLSRLDAGGWHSPAFAGEPVPHLVAIARFCRRQSFALNIEIKPTPGQEAATGRTVAQAAQRLWQGDALQPLMSSFSPEALEAAAAATPALPLALLLDECPADALDQARALGCVAVVFNHRLLDAGLIRAAHDHGLRVLAFTVNEADRARALIENGIDGLITDAVDRLGPTDPPR